LVERLLLRDVRIKYRPALLAEQRQHARDLVHRVPADLPAGGGKFLDRFHERARLRADRAILHIDDQQRRTLAETGASGEARGAGSLLLALRTDAVPGIHREDPMLSPRLVPRL